MPNGISYVMLQEMYIPEKDPNYNGNNIANGVQTRKGRISDEIDFMNHVLEEAYAATDNSDLLPQKDEDEQSGDCETCFLGINLRALWTPKGKLEIWDDNILVPASTKQVRYIVRYETYVCNKNLDIAQKAVADTCTRPVYGYRTESVGSKVGGYMPLEGANVLVRDTWTLDSDITDSSGDFSFKRLRAKVRYIIQWDRYEFSIRDNTGLFQAEDKSEKMYDESWNHKIEGGREEYRGKIFQAAMQYYYGNIGNLTRPPSNGTWKTQIKIGAFENNDKDSSALMWGKITRGVIPSVAIRAYGVDSEETYGTTIHELAHAAHFALSPDKYITNGYDAYIGNQSSAKRLLESFPRGVEIYLTKLRYVSLGRTDYKYFGDDLQNRSLISSQLYTSGIYDLTDALNQRSEFGSGRPVDDVSGVSWLTINNAMKDADNWNEFRDIMINKYPKQSSQITELFANWN